MMPFAGRRLLKVPVCRTPTCRSLSKVRGPQQLVALHADCRTSDWSSLLLGAGGCVAAFAHWFLHLRRQPLQAENVCESQDRMFSNARLTCFGEAMLRYIPDPDAIGGPSRFTSSWLKNAGGAELNITVALSRLGWGEKARWVSVVACGPLGDELLQLASQAYEDGRGVGNLSLVRREPGDVGIYHVWPREGKVWYQRYNSVFGLMNPAWFSDQFWEDVLASPGEAVKEGELAPPHVLHVTGITPQISSNAHKAWWRALRAAHSLRKAHRQDPSKPRIIVTMDFNHRPNLGTLDDLWMMVEQHLGTTDLFMLAVGNLPQVAELLHAPEVNPFKDATIAKGVAGADALDAAVSRSLKALQKQLGNKTAIGVCLKCVKEERLAPGELSGQLRWSMVCLKDGEVVSTLRTAIEHRPKEPIGGGDSWLSGVIDGLVGTIGPAAAAPNWSIEMWRAAMQRGDMLAVLKQECIGDFSNVSKDELHSALVAHRSKPAYAWKSASLP